MISLAMAATGACAEVALVLRLTYATGSGWAVAALWLSSTIPAILLAPSIGTILDRLDTVLILSGAAVIQAGVYLGLALVPGVGPVIALCVALGGSAAAIVPGLYVLAGALFSDERSSASALTGFQATHWAGATAGPLLGALLVSRSGPRVPLLIDCCSAAVCFVLLRRLRPRPRPPAPGRQTGDSAWAGLRLLAGDSALRLVLVPISLVISALNLAVVVDVFLATRVLHGGSLGYGFLVSFWGSGMVAGSLLAPRIRQRNWLSLIGAGALLATLGLAAAGASPTLGLAVLAYLLGGVGNGIEANGARQFIQRRTPTDLRGRVFAAYLAVGSGASILGTVVGGVVLGPLGARGSLELAACLSGVGGLGLVWIGLARSGGAGGG
jgi:MFS family permease